MTYVFSLFIFVLNIVIMTSHKNNQLFIQKKREEIHKNTLPN